MASPPKPRILVVEDELFLRDIYVQTLKDAKYRVDSASDGEEALIKMTQGGYDLVLLDVMLPKQDGQQILTKLKQTPPKHPNGKIVYTTNLSQDPKFQAQAKKLGVSGHIIKADLNPDEFLQKVRQFLQT